MRIDIRGAIVPNDDKWVYDWLEWEATAPKDIFAAIAKANGEVLDVYISSPGGDVYAGMDIYSALRDYSGGVNIHVVSRADSAASLIVCAGRSDITPGGIVMIHRVSSNAQGNAEDMRHAAEVLDKHDEAVCAVYQNKTGLSRGQILEMMSRETYLTAEEAVRLGFVDSVSEGALRFTASSTAMLTPENIERIRAIAGRAGEDATRMIARAKLNLLKLGGTR